MIDGGVEILNLPTIGDLLKRLYEHAGESAPKGQWGYYPEAKGEILTEEMAAKIPETRKWIGKPVYDANALVEAYVGEFLEGGLQERIRFQYEEWCYGHIGEEITELVQLPGAAVFRTDANGNFRDVAYLYQKNGDGPLDWNIFCCNDPDKGLCIEKLDHSWDRWGLISMIMRYDVKGPMTKDLKPLEPGTPYAIVGSSVLNFRKSPKEELITSLPNGTIVRLTGNISGDWTEVMVGDQKGYVFSQFLEKHLEG